MTLRFLLIFFGFFCLFYAAKIGILDSKISQKVEMTNANLLELSKNIRCKKRLSHFSPKDFDLHVEDFARSTSSRLMKTKEEKFTNILKLYEALKIKSFLDGNYFDPFSPNHNDLKKSIIDLIYYAILLLKDNWKQTYTI